MGLMMGPPEIPTSTRRAVYLFRASSLSRSLSFDDGLAKELTPISVNVEPYICSQGSPQFSDHCNLITGLCRSDIQSLIVAAVGSEWGQ